MGSAVTPAVAGDWVFLWTTQRENTLAAMARADGRVRWIRPLGRYKNEEKRRDPINWATPVLAGGRLLVANSIAELVEIDPADGEIAGRMKLPAGVVLQPAVAGGVMYVLCEDASVAAIQGGA